MTPSVKTLLATAAIGAAGLAPLTSASALSIVKAIYSETNPGGLITPLDPFGTILNTSLYETVTAKPGDFCSAPGNCTYYFYFTLAGFAAGATTQIQLQAVSMGVAMPLDYDLFSGTPGPTPLPTADPSFLAASGPSGTVGQVIFTTLGDGAYYVQVAPSQVFADGEVGSGSLSVTDAVGRDGGPDPTVPEPATWAMMLVGFGGVGAALRRRQAALALINA